MSRSFRYLGYAFKAVLLLLLITLVYFIFLFDHEGVITEGSFRDIPIGSTKSDVIERARDIRDSYRMEISIHGYYEEGGQFRDIDTVRKRQPVDSAILQDLQRADQWLLFSSSVYGEGITITFQDDKVKSIRFLRAPLDP